MKLNKKFAVLGGDKRQLYLAQSIAKDGFPVCLCFFDSLNTGEIIDKSFDEAVSGADIIILPLPVTRDGEYLNTPFSEKKVRLDDNFAKHLAGKRVFGGIVGKLKSTSGLYKSVECYDYYDREELTVGNAMLTAEGAVAMAINELPISLNGSKCLVTGFGRIGKALCHYLRSVYADVTCAARKDHDIMHINSIGCRGVRYGTIDESYDLILNTVPAPVLTQSILSKQTPETVIIELASAPGGVDLDAAKRLSIKVVNGQSIPGKVSPKTSGEYIKEAIYNIM